MRAIERMTLYEYNLRMTAYKLSWLDQEKMIHELAWANQQVQATKTVGKKTVPVYDTFEKFFNYKKHEDELMGVSKLPKDANLQRLLSKANS
jgi:hypothetical protein